MAQISRTTNPTGLTNVDRRHFVIRTSGTGVERQFLIDRIDLAGAKLAPDTIVGCVAHAGNAEEYFQLGLASKLDGKWRPIPGLNNGRPLRFRFLFTKPGESKLVGYADHVRAVNESGDLGPSLVDIEPTNLQGAAWRLELPPSNAGIDEKPNILIERDIFPTAAAAVRSSAFIALVMPEVMRRIASELGRHIDSISDEASWMFPWGGFLDSLQVTLLTADDIESEVVDGWADDVSNRFSRGDSVKLHLLRFVGELHGGDLP